MLEIFLQAVHRGQLQFLLGLFLSYHVLFDKRQELIKDCKLIVYDIPFNCIYFETETKVSFPKKYKINGKEIKIDLWKYCD